MKILRTLAIIAIISNLVLANNLRDAELKDGISIEKATNKPINGIWKSYYESGALQHEVQYKNGKEDGITKIYLESGALREESQWKNGKEDGIAKAYYESGALRQESQQKNGKLDGIAKTYYENGKHFATFIYKNGEPISGKCSNNRPLNNAELSNWSKGLSISCK